MGQLELFKQQIVELVFAAVATTVMRLVLPRSVTNETGPSTRNACVKVILSPLMK